MKEIVFVLFSVCSLASSMYVVSAPEDAPDIPVFPQIYEANATLNLPYAEIVEPIQIWYDAVNNRSRIDYYDGLMKTYQRADLPTPVNQKIVYMTTENVFNALTCLEVNGTTDNETGESTVQIQSILPNMTEYQHVGQKTYDGNTYDIWEKLWTVGEKDNTYRFWTRKEGNDTIPVRFEMLGRNPILGGSHFDRYEIIYSGFHKTDHISEDIFDVSSFNLTCRPFPGPGVDTGISMNPMQEFINDRDEHVDPMFEDFKDNHNKSYDDGVEHTQRKKNFLHNLRFINSHNRAGKSYTVGVNHLADWSDNEIKILRGRIHSSKVPNSAEEFDSSHYNTKDLPISLDWRLFGAVTPVKDQAVCGSCWSFGTTGTIEGAHFIKNQKLELLSEQSLIDCSWGEGNNGCDGGEDYRAYDWIKLHGLPKTKDYGPYLGADGKCHYNSTDKEERVFVKSYVNVTSRNPEDVRLALFYEGPLSVSIDASLKSFSFYSNGIYEDPACKSDVDHLDHSVLAVGYGIQAGRHYWLIKNSWSTYWGNDGYILINQENDCGVSTQATFVNL